MTKNINLEKELKLMVAMDLTQMDPMLLNYISFLNSVWNIKHIFFTHNIKQYALHNLYEEFLEDNISLEEIVEKELEKTIAENYTGQAAHTLLITSDNYTEGILTEIAKEYKIDVVVAGTKDELQGTGALSQKLVRMLHCDLLLVPEQTRFQLKKVLVPTDFSANSAKSFLAARSLTEHKNGEIVALHVFNIPSFYFPYIDTRKATDKTVKHLDEKFQQFSKKHHLPDYIQFRYIDRQELSVEEVIEMEADKGNFDIVVVSARGANNLTTLFVGSITNDMVIRNTKMPLLIAK